MDNPKILGKFLLFVGQDQLGDNYLTNSHTWVSQNILGKFGIFRPLHTNHVWEHFRTHGITEKILNCFSGWFGGSAEGA